MQSHDCPSTFDPFIVTTRDDGAIYDMLNQTKLFSTVSIFPMQLTQGCHADRYSLDNGVEVTKDILLPALTVLVSTLEISCPI